MINLMWLFTVLSSLIVISLNFSFCLELSFLFLCIWFWSTTFGDSVVRWLSDTDSSSSCSSMCVSLADASNVSPSCKAQWFISLSCFLYFLWLWNNYKTKTTKMCYHVVTKNNSWMTDNSLVIIYLQIVWWYHKGNIHDEYWKTKGFIVNPFLILSYVTRKTFIK